MFSGSNDKKILTYRVKKNDNKHTKHSDDFNKCTIYSTGYEEKEKNNKQSSDTKSVNKEIHNLEDLPDNIFGFKDLTIGMVLFFAAYMGLKKYSISAEKILFLVIGPFDFNTTLGENFYFYFFELWSGFCFIVFGVRCLIINFCEGKISKFFLTLIDIISSIVMLFPIVVSLIDNFSVQLLLYTFLFFGMWVFLFLQRMILTYKI